MDALAYPGTFEGYNQASIQDAFHFDTNQFLIPVDGECSPLDYEDLFSLLNQAGAPESGGSSSAAIPVPSSDSDGRAASLGPAPVPATTSAPVLQPSQQRQQQQAEQPKASKAAREATSKRIREAGGSTKSKQHQVKELEALAAKAAEDLERLQLENSELRFRSRILEQVVQIREHQLKVMRGGAADLPQYWGSPAAAAAAAVAAKNPGTCPLAAAAVAAAAAAGGSMSAAEAIRTSGCGCLMTGGLSAEDRERFRSLGKSQLLDGWKHFLSEVAVPLLALEADGTDEAAAGRVRQLASEVSHLYKHASLLAPDTVMVALQTHLETDALCSAESGHWRNVVRTLGLSAEQVRELVAVYRLFRGVMAGLLAERRAINARLAASDVHGGPEELRAAAESLHVSAECEVMLVLQRSMRREKAAHLLLRGFLFGRTLTVLQFVKAAVYAYPWMPDATAIIATVAEAAEAPGGV